MRRLTTSGYWLWQIRAACIGGLLRFGPTWVLTWMAGRGPALTAPRAQVHPLRARLTRGELGAMGEEIAARSLASSGLTLLGRNIQAREAELDILALDHNSALIVVEVKTGWWPEDARAPWTRPGDHVSKRSVMRRSAAARRIARAMPAPPAQRAARFEVVEVICGRGRLGAITVRTDRTHHPHTWAGASRQT